MSNYQCSLKMTYRLLFLVLIWILGIVSGYIIEPGPQVKATKGAVWPKPQVQSHGGGYLVVRPPVFKFQVIKEDCKLLQQGLQRYIKIITDSTNLGRRSKRGKQSIPPNRYKTWQKDEYFLGYLDSLDVELTQPCGPNNIPNINMDELYTLNINYPQNQYGILKAKSIWGILRGLETFSQLLYLAEDGVAQLIINTTAILDYPRFSHRGLLLDTSRHYMPMFTILQILDGMAYNKLNVFHWHITDDQSFPYQSVAFPELSQKGAYHKSMIYTPADVQKVIRHATRRGIRVMPEFDTPGHTRSWGVAKPELLTPCYKGNEPDGSLGPLDPTKKETYNFLESFFQEVITVFPEQYVHLGGDEVGFECWQSNPNIYRFMAKHNMSKNYAALEEYYIQKLVDIVDDLNASSLVWEEVFANGVRLPKETIVQVWLNNEILPNATKAGYPTLWSSCWYLDHLSTGGDWRKYYSCDPHTSFNLTPEQEKLVIGGEACMWSEVVDATNVIQRIFPRASAVAEKLWSAKTVTNQKDAEKRLEEHSCRMQIRGIPSQPPNGPGFCL